MLTTNDFLVNFLNKVNLKLPQDFLEGVKK